MKNFLKGIANVLNIAGGSDYFESIKNRTDEEAIRSEWEAIGNDIWIVINDLNNDR